MVTKEAQTFSSGENAAQKCKATSLLSLWLLLLPCGYNLVLGKGVSGQVFLLKCLRCFYGFQSASVPPQCPESPLCNPKSWLHSLGSRAAVITTAQLFSTSRLFLL